jgi:hypothetical protein
MYVCVYVCLCYFSVVVVGPSFSTGLFDGLDAPLPVHPDPSSKGSEKKRKKLMKSYHKKVKKRDNDISNIAREASLYDCSCKKMCLASVGGSVSESVNMLKQYMTPWMNMDKKEHRQKFFAILEGCAHGVTEGGHLDKR